MIPDQRIPPQPEPIPARGVGQKLAVRRLECGRNTHPRRRPGPRSGGCDVGDGRIRSRRKSSSASWPCPRTSPRVDGRSPRMSPPYDRPLHPLPGTFPVPALGGAVILPRPLLAVQIIGPSWCSTPTLHSPGAGTRRSSTPRGTTYRSGLLPRPRVGEMNSSSSSGSNSLPLRLGRAEDHRRRLGNLPMGRDRRLRTVSSPPESARFRFGFLQFFDAHLRGAAEEVTLLPNALFSGRTY